MPAFLPQLFSDTDHYWTIDGIDACRRKVKCVPDGRQDRHELRIESRCGIIRPRCELVRYGLIFFIDVTADGTDDQVDGPGDAHGPRVLSRPRLAFHYRISTMCTDEDRGSLATDRGVIRLPNRSSSTTNLISPSLRFLIVLRFFGSLQHYRGPMPTRGSRCCAISNRDAAGLRFTRLTRARPVTSRDACESGLSPEAPGSPGRSRRT